MAEIISSNPISRHITEYITDDPNVKHYKCKTLQNPDYYFGLGNKLDSGQSVWEFLK